MVLEWVKTRTGEKLYECPLHKHWHYDLPLADEDDCWHCEFNQGVDPKCRCMAQEFVRSVSDLDLPATERHQKRDAYRAENDAAYAMKNKKVQQQQATVVPSSGAEVTKPTVPTPTKETRNNRQHIGYMDVKGCEPHSAKPVRDRFGNQWHYCIKCKDWYLQHDMASYLGAFGPVKGECKQCHAKKIAEMRKRMGI
jgi:hypothetical protein